MGIHEDDSGESRVRDMEKRRRAEAPVGQWRSSVLIFFMVALTAIWTKLIHGRLLLIDPSSDQGREATGTVGGSWTWLG